MNCMHKDWRRGKGIGLSQTSDSMPQLQGQQYQNMDQGKIKYGWMKCQSDLPVISIWSQLMLVVLMKDLTDWKEKLDSCLEI